MAQITIDHAQLADFCRKHHIRKLAFFGSVLRDEFRPDSSDRLLNLALVRLLEIIGEAANQVPKAEQTLYTQIPWPQIISLRNRLIHGYDGERSSCHLRQHARS